MLVTDVIFESMTFQNSNVSGVCDTYVYEILGARF